MSDEPPPLVPADDEGSHIGTLSEHGSTDEPVNPVTETRMVGWTASSSSSSDNKSRNIRPMHVRLSVRIHHISFLHPGLDPGGATLTTNRGKRKKLFKKNDGPAGAPGPMAFGQRRGSWKNPNKSKTRRSSGYDDSRHNYEVEEESEKKGSDAAEISEIISSEAFRLSRDGIIQQHYALTRGLEEPSSGDGAMSPRAADMAETVRYYKECAKRPKGYRRLVVSSMIPTEDNKIPRPPVKRDSMLTGMSSWGLDSGAIEKDASKPDEEDLFDNVEYRYIGPPNTGPAFFQLLRQHGAASFGRFLPEVACHVPTHSVAFELRKSKGMTKRGGSASTQPIVIEAPHVIWGDARDKTLARIADEGCPLIDSREFEYVSNSNLKDAELSETLMVCGATVWVKDAKNEDLNMGTTANLRSKNANTMVKAEYYGGKMADGVRNTAKGVAKGVVGVGKALTPSSKDKAVDASVAASVTSNIPTPSSTNQTTPKKKKVMFGGMPKMRRKKKKGATREDASVSSAALDDASIASLASESVGTQPGVVSSTEIVTEPLSREADVDPLPEQDASEYAAVKPTPYILIVDDVINIQVVSFPENDVIAKFPISVASVMTQRNINDRVGDPLKPSELTATLIQEPSAPKMQWGCELKITIRAVEVKPHVPRVVIPEMPASLGVLQTELKNLTDLMKSMGKSQAEIDEALRQKEKEVSEREQTLNRAIISAGLGVGENGGANPDEIRMQQMFYDEREHKSVERKVKKKSRLSMSQKSMLQDARFDPAVANTNAYNNEDKILKLLSTHFPRVDESAVTPKRSNHQSKSGDIRASVSLAIAESLDEHFGEHLDAPTVELVNQSLRQHTLLGHSHDESSMTASEVKDWCYDVASKLSLSASPKGKETKRSITQIQNVIIASVGGVMADSITHPESEVKNMPPDVIDEMNGWCMSILSKLDSCAEELADHDDDESTQFSCNADQLEDGNDISERSFTELAELENAKRGSIISSSDGSDFQLHLPNIAAKNRSVANDSDSIDSDDDIWKQASSRRQSAIMNSGNLQRVLRASALSTFDEAVPGRDSVNPRDVERLLKGMRDSHFQVHRSYTIRDDKSPRKISPRKQQEESQPTPTSSSIVVYLVAVFFVFMTAMLAAKYFDIVLVVNQKK